jgi:parallel beta-helix repeat protein/predicted outer membrane repeat protein
VLYAAPTTQGSGDCSGWANACALRYALSIAVSGDEIWVKKEVHYPGTSRTDTFTLKNNVALYGGFAGNETSRDQRNWQSNVTILSGDIDQDDTDNDGNYIAETSADIQGSNAYHVVTGSGTDSTAILDGFVVTAGQANETSSPNDRGGGMYNVSSSPALTNVTFSGNTATYFGGGMYNTSSSPTLTDVTFSGNAAAITSGGGMYNSSSNPTLIGVTFSSNTANSNGGGMHNEGSSPTLTSVTFSGNTANSYGGGVYNASSSNPTLTDVTFSNNTALDGGAMYNSSSSPTLTDVTFSSNTASKRGGAMYNSSSSPTLTGVSFSSNTAGESGGGMYNVSSSPTLTDVTFSGNTVTAGSGGGMYNFFSSNPPLTNVTFSGNTATTGGGMYNFYSSPTLKNVVMWGDSATSGPEIYNSSSTPSISYSDIQGCGGSGGGWQSTCGTDNGGNIDANPLFVNSAGGNLRLGFGSPATDAGTNSGCPTTDRDGLPRPNDGDANGTATCDMGAYETGTMTCSVSQGGTYTFDNHSGVSIYVATLGSQLSCLYVDEMELNHPNATSGVRTGRYWLIRGLQSDKQTNASGFELTLTLPTNFTPDSNDRVCRYTGSGQIWSCAMSSYTTNSITRQQITELSDWAAGNNVGPTAVRLNVLMARQCGAPYLAAGLAELVLLVGLGLWGMSRATPRPRRLLPAPRGEW